MLAPIRSNRPKGTDGQRVRPAELCLMSARSAESALVAKAGSIHSSPDLPAQTPTKPERRAQARSEVDTSVTISFVRTGAKSAGRIVDLSLGGCRIRCDDRFPVGIYTRVEVEFSLEGLPFRLGGVIQAIHDRSTVGIRFLDMSSRRREQVEQLMVEIRHDREQGNEGTREQENKGDGSSTGIKGRRA